MTKKAKPAPVVEQAESATTKDFHIGATDPGPQLAGRAVIAWNRIVPDPLNPRKAFDEEGIDELADSIAEHGLLENLVVRPAAPMEGHDGLVHRLVAGERRWRAIGRLIDSDEDPDFTPEHPVEVQIRDITDQQHAILALIENLQRKDLKPLEEANAFRRLTDEFGIATADIAKSINCTQRLVQQRLQLLDLREADAKALEAGSINIEEARRRLANYAKPIEISAEARLVFLEIAHAILALPEPRFWSDVPCDYRNSEPAQAIAALKEHNLVYFGRDWQTGQAEVRLAYSARGFLAQLTGFEDLNREAVNTALTAVRGEAGAGADLPLDGPYVTPWLNAPFEIDPAVAKEAAARLQANKDRDAEWARERQERDAKEKARKAAASEVLALVPTLAEREDRADQITSAMARLNSPLPWRFDPGADGAEATIIDAAGVPVEIGYDSDLLPLIMAAVNIAVGQAPMIAQIMDEYDFAELVGEAATETLDEDVDGADVLNAWLKTEGLTFAALGREWGPDQAREIGAAYAKHRAETKGAPDEGDDDPELTPALKKLAGVRAEPAAEEV